VFFEYHLVAFQCSWVNSFRRRRLYLHPYPYMFYHCWNRRVTCSCYRSTCK